MRHPPPTNERYFLADIHLSPDRPDITAAFLAALAHIAAAKPAAVYLMGDLFHAWLGDDIESENPFTRTIVQAIAALPCPVYFQHGNRDFLLSRAFAREARLILLPDRHIIFLNGQRIVLEHGDLLCTRDTGYQRLRRILRNRPLQRLYYRLPRIIKHSIAKQLKSKSKTHKHRKTARTTDADRDEIARILAQYRADILIHGHTHRPAIHDENGKTRYVLGDWTENGGQVLHYRSGTWQLEQLPIQKR